MAQDEDGESRLIALRQEILKELEARAAFGRFTGRQPADVPNHTFQLRSSHRCLSSGMRFT
jgi:hypothetical protein